MSLLTPAIQGSESLWFCMLMAFIIAFLQFLGVHGFNVVSGIILPLLIANTGANAACTAGASLQKYSLYQCSKCLEYFVT